HPRTNTIRNLLILIATCRRRNRLLLSLLLLLRMAMIEMLIVFSWNHSFPFNISSGISWYGNFSWNILTGTLPEIVKYPCFSVSSFIRLIYLHAVDDETSNTFATSFEVSTFLIISFPPIYLFLM